MVGWCYRGYEKFWSVLTQTNGEESQGSNQLTQFHLKSGHQNSVSVQNKRYNNRKWVHQVLTTKIITSGCSMQCIACFCCSLKTTIRQIWTDIITSAKEVYVSAMVCWFVCHCQWDYSKKLRINFLEISQKGRLLYKKKLISFGSRNFFSLSSTLQRCPARMNEINCYEKSCYYRACVELGKATTQNPSMAQPLTLNEWFI